ncbi:hypothetical protein BpHYR1_051867 [Brachionus plicatilis]|uniref:Uncharacterized protein n=1 Tax=Brachionus plicatilis TaxID=10195 RepID=A0A3M7RF48_BRAPC|nr:hypothetical protein BpHYR1_051867 [Brachionus plicatilis]
MSILFEFVFCNGKKVEQSILHYIEFYLFYLYLKIAMAFSFKHKKGETKNDALCYNLNIII